LIDFPDTMVLPELTTRNEITFEFSYIGYATSNFEEKWSFTKIGPIFCGTS